MIRRMLAPFAAAGALLTPALALAQEATPAADEGGGSPIYGYLAFAALAGIFLMVLCKSSRRS